MHVKCMVCAGCAQCPRICYMRDLLCSGHVSVFTPVLGTPMFTHVLGTPVFMHCWAILMFMHCWVHLCSCTCWGSLLFMRVLSFTKVYVFLGAPMFTYVLSTPVFMHF